MFRSIHGSQLFWGSIVWAIHQETAISLHKFTKPILGPTFKSRTPTLILSQWKTHISNPTDSKLSCFWPCDFLKIAWPKKQFWNPFKFGTIMCYRTPFKGTIFRYVPLKRVLKMKGVRIVHILAHRHHHHHHRHHKKIRIISIEFQHHQGSRAAGGFHRPPQRRANPTMVIIISSSSSSFSSSSSSSSSSSPSSSFSSSSSSSSSTSTSSSHLEDLFRGKILVDAKLSTSTVCGLQK